MTSSRGDVFPVRFLDSNLTTFKKRPALVVQADGLNTGLAQCIVACITSNMARTGPARVAIQQHSAAGRRMGLLTDSVVMTDNLATVLDREVDKVIGRCPIMGAVDAALRTTLGL
jgi:mRNA interferase MazF